MKFRPEADIYPLMSDEELKKLALDIDENGQHVPISLFQGAILDGRNRYTAITKYCAAKREPAFETVAPESPMRFVISRNEKRRHLTDSQRALAAAKALPFYEAEAKERMRRGGRPSKSEKKGAPNGAPINKVRASDQAAADFGTTPRTVQRAQSVLEKGSAEVVVAVETGALSLGKADEIVKKCPTKKAQTETVKRVAKSKMVTRVKGLTGQVEWYTPRKYLDSAVSVMGQIDLDPASSDHAQQHVQAKSYYTMEVNGLQQEWSGKVWLNPPYAMPEVKLFVQKMSDSFDEGKIEQGILLTNNATDTEWFHRAAKSCSAVCFTRGRISFLEVIDGESVEKGSPTHGQSFFYFGDDVEGFSNAFDEHGLIMVPLRARRHA